ncbi:MAG: hypothetical protein K1X79_11500 [Oligoflexia bacterium]|nr:hypothetical protein [Oligoflexia bacterium]
MWATKEFLLACKALGEAGIRFNFKVGASVARGFADVGEEEFIVLPGNKLLSAYTGKLSEIDSDNVAFFFVLPTVDEMTDALQRSSFDIESISFENQRHWVLRCRHVSSERQLVVRHSQLSCAFAEALRQSVG